jgi:hypothetical protein
MRRAVCLLLLGRKILWGVHHLKAQVLTWQEVDSLLGSELNYPRLLPNIMKLILKQVKRAETQMSRLF